ncbi:TlpA family protein disulfide reductase [Candidatus Daviesbacteria bacterium]|nr:TlpA family protein disulfide reductase [Candidatus Daviesbacteria bacterium]
MKNKNIILIIVGVVIVGAILVLTNPFKKQQSPFVPTNGSTSSAQVADFELESFAGEKIKLSQFAGQPIFIDFWAAWCPFCIEEMTEIEKIHQEFPQLVILGIHRSETEGVDVGTKFAKERGVKYPLLKDLTGEVYKTLTGGRQFMPYALFIDKAGQIVKVKAGPKTAEEMRQIVKELVP